MNVHTQAHINTPELLGVALLDLRPLLHKLNVKIQKVEA